MDASTVGYFFLRKPTLLTKRAEKGTKGYRKFVHANLATEAGCHDAKGDLDYKPIDYE